MKAKTVLIATGAIIAGLALIGYTKVKKLQAVFDRMTIRPSGISALQFGIPYINFKLDIKITNPTSEDFSVTGASLVKLKRIIVYRKGKLLGTGMLDMDGIEIPAGQSVEIKYIPFSVALENVMYNLLQMEGFSIEQLTIVGIVEVLGEEYYIEG